MFSQKKRRNYKLIYIFIGLIILIMFGLFYWNNSSKTTVINRQISSEVTQKNESHPTSKEKKMETYYLVKSNNNIVKIYYSNEDGELIDMENTDIIYETLTLEDQKKFNRGIKVSNKNDLNELLMNYES